MIIVAFITSTLTGRIKKTAYTASKIANISKIMLATNHQLHQDSSEDDVVNCGCNLLSELLKRNIIYYTVENNELINSYFVSVDDETNIMNISSVYLLLTLKCVIIHLYLNVLF